MRADWVKHTNDTDSLILIFAGWGSDKALYSHIYVEGWDVLVCYDFDGSDFDTSLIAGYNTIYLYAWSLGVVAAARHLSNVDLTAAFAINGTEWPCDDRRGIPVNIYCGTADTLSIPNLERFRRRMFVSRDEYAAVSGRLPVSPDIESLRSQLYHVCQQPALTHGASFWTRAYISKSDRIFPASAQHNAWQNRGIEVCEIPGGHFVDIADIVNNTIPNPRKVGQKFAASLDTYDDNASAQQQIVSRLAQKIASIPHPIGGCMLEIGQGSGYSTRRFADVLHPDEIDCVDLYETPVTDVATVVRYHISDGERWVAGADREWDSIVSSSAIQWFSDVRKFFAHASRCLHRQGILACTTFAPGNLSEFDTLRPAPMLYRHPYELEEALRKHFGEVRVDTEEIRVVFDTSRDALLHLRRTGVGGSGKHEMTLNQLSKAIPQDAEGRYYLTYRPVYILASHPL